MELSKVSCGRWISESCTHAMKSAMMPNIVYSCCWNPGRGSLVEEDLTGVKQPYVPLRHQAARYRKGDSCSTEYPFPLCSI